MARRLLVLLALLLVPAAAAAVDFDCEQRAFDLSACTVPADTSSCPKICTDPNDPATCGMLPLPELLDTVRHVADQPILRDVTVLEGPHTGVSLSMVTLSTSADTIFTAARDRLCVPPPLPPGSSPPPPPGGGGAPPGSGLIGHNPGLIGENPGLRGPDPRIKIPR